MEDEALLERAARGDAATFRRLYERHSAPLFRFAYRLCGSVAAAEDIAHDCWVALLGGSMRWDPRRSPLRTYLLGVVRHMALRRFRESARERECRGEAPPADPLEALLAGELSAAVERAVAALPLLQREVVVLFEYEGLSLEETAAVTGVPVGAVKSRLHRARENLRRMLAPEFAHGR